MFPPSSGRIPFNEDPNPNTYSSGPSTPLKNQTYSFSPSKSYSRQSSSSDTDLSLTPKTGKALPPTFRLSCVSLFIFLFNPFFAFWHLSYQNDVKIGDLTVHTSSSKGFLQGQNFHPACISTVLDNMRITFCTKKLYSSQNKTSPEH